jgi:hypothetical protein
VTPAPRALLLAAIQAADLVVTHRSPAYGDEHLDHLGVPRRLRPVLPAIKATAVAALVVTARRPAARSVAGTGMVGYYLTAAGFHAAAGDPLPRALPALGCAVLATSLV